MPRHFRLVIINPKRRGAGFHRDGHDASLNANRLGRFDRGKVDLSGLPANRRLQTGVALLMPHRCVASNQAESRYNWVRRDSCFN
ncbi:hypothetical protein Poly24_40380 [Rosistilla carotiformis]|uniref:Uncharacterized protein n=1 Tax=Rosistilla carotiformis TaxID=2528017 RepID=A0A518JXP4_9BACT|nr:hypothetical protein Poly24_40380 [Rosistilla carotiformis]